MLHAIITTIQEPTDCVLGLVDRLSAIGGKLIVAGDSKGPARFSGPEGSSWPVDFLSLADQESAGFSLARDLPTKHYARKNIAYLRAIRDGASCIYETDDDNAPNESWEPRSETINQAVAVNATEDPHWVNVYRYYSQENIWPRGLPLDEIRKEPPALQPLDGPKRSPVQQGLVNGSPDVDAIWRLVMDRDFSFEDAPSVHLAPGNWCPFNTQTTWWWPVAYPLLYIPSYCSFRMCDIWKSFIAQRCLWAMGLGITFHAPEVIQVRNPHDLTRDFRDEVPGYEQNRKIAAILDALVLSPDETDVAANLLRCYEELVDHGIFPAEELTLVRAWLDDLAEIELQSKAAA